MTPQNEEIDYIRLEQALFSAIEEKRGVLTTKSAPPQTMPPVRMTPRQAILKRNETIPTTQAVGRIAASPTVSCPPAIPIVISGEEITNEVVKCLLHYGMDTVSVVKE